MWFLATLCGENIVVQHTNVYRDETLIPLQVHAMKQFSVDDSKVRYEL